MVVAFGEAGNNGEGEPAQPASRIVENSHNPKRILAAGIL